MRQINLTFYKIIDHFEKGNRSFCLTHDTANPTIQPVALAT
jgi:hypothetical protein